METNPVLAELQNLSPTAKATLIQAHTAANPMQGTQAPQLANLRQPPEQAPPSLQAPSQMQPVPQLGMQQPNVMLGKQPKGTLIGDQQALQEMAGKKAPLESVYGKITGSEFGQNHAKLGKLLGVLGQIPATAVDIAASAALPRIGALIPGTSINRGLQLSALQNRIGQEESNAEKEAQTREANARVPLEQEQTRHMQEQLDIQRQQIAAGLAEHNLKMDENNKIVPMTEAELGPLGQAQVEAARNPWLHEAGNQPLGASIPQLNSGMLARYQVLHPEAKELPAAFALTGNATKSDFDRVDKLLQATESASGTQEQRKVAEEMRRQTQELMRQRMQQGEKKTADAVTEKEYTHFRDKWEKELGTYNGQVNNLDKAQMLIGQGAMGDAIGEIKTLSGLASGQGSGVRITQAELNSIIHARNFKGDFDAWMNKFGNGKNITNQQEAEIKNVLSAIQQLASVKEAVLNKGLDDANNATDTKTIRQIDSQMRHVLMGGK